MMSERRCMNRLEHRIVTGGVLIGTGILAQVLTLLWDHPLAFLVFLFAASPLVLAGSVLCLRSLTDGESRDVR
jgi:hypothetical protein